MTKVTEAPVQSFVDPSDLLGEVSESLAELAERRYQLRVKRTKQLALLRELKLEDNSDALRALAIHVSNLFTSGNLTQWIPRLAAIRDWEAEVFSPDGNRKATKQAEQQALKVNSLLFGGSLLEAIRNRRGTRAMLD